MNNQPPENNIPQNNSEKTENVFEFVKKVCFNKIIFMNINWKKYFNIHNIIFSFVLLIFTSIAVNLIKFGFGMFLLFSFLGPHGWPFVFYHGGSLFPFLGGSKEAYFSLIKLLSDLAIFYLIVIISSFIASKIKKESKIIIFTISIGVVILLFVVLTIIDNFRGYCFSKECEVKRIREIKASCEDRGRKWIEGAGDIIGTCK